MPRHPARPTTQLGVAVQTRRGATPLRALGDELGLNDTTLSRIERGTHRPSADTAVALARWLGWSVEAVLEAAKTPVERGA